MRSHEFHVQARGVVYGAQLRQTLILRVEHSLVIKQILYLLRLLFVVSWNFISSISILANAVQY